MMKGKSHLLLVTGRDVQPFLAQEASGKASHENAAAPDGEKSSL